MNGAHEDEPGAQLTAAHERPAPAYPVTSLDDHRLSTGTGTVRENRIRIGKDCLGHFLRPPDRRPVGIPIPYTPGNRSVRTCEFFEDLRRRHRGEVEAAVCLGQVDAKETCASELARQIFR